MRPRECNPRFIADGRDVEGEIEVYVHMHKGVIEGHRRHPHAALDPRQGRIDGDVQFVMDDVVEELARRGLRGEERSRARRAFRSHDLALAKDVAVRAEIGLLSENPQGEDDDRDGGGENSKHHISLRQRTLLQ